MLAYPLFIGWWEVVIIAFIILLLFGGKKIPELMKGVAKGVKSFKEGLSEIEDDLNIPESQKKSNKILDTTLAEKKEKSE